MRTASSFVKLGLITLGVLSASGCGVQEIQQAKIQDNLGAAYQKLTIGQTAKARQWVDRAVEVDPAAVTTYVSIVKDEDVGKDDSAGVCINNVFLATGDYKTDEIYMTQAVAKFPKNYEPLLALMNVQRLLGETAAETQTAKSLIAMVEGQVAKGDIDGTKLRALGDAYWFAGNEQKSVATFQRVMTFHPTDWVAFNDLADEYAELNDKPHLAQALSLANTAVSKADRMNVDEEIVDSARDTVGWVQYRLGQYAQARDNVRQAALSDPREPEIRYHLAVISLALGDKVTAKSEVRRALLLAPDYAAGKTLDAQLKDVPAPKDDLPTFDAASLDANQ